MGLEEAHRGRFDSGSGFVSLNNFTSSIVNAALGNYSNLQSLDLSSNSVNGDISELLEGLSGCCNSSLKELILGSNKFNGKLPDSLGHLNYLRSLVLNDNLISGPILESIGRLFFLKELDLSFNEMNGSIPTSLGRLTELTKLQLFHNSWKGLVSQNHLQGLAKLRVFSIDMLYLSNNQIGGVVPNSLGFSLVDLSFNHLEGTIPLWPNITFLFLNNNLFSGAIPWTIGSVMSLLITLNLSGNSLNCTIPLSICKLNALIGIYLSDNHLSRQIPIHLGDLRVLGSIDLSQNNLSGHVPELMCSLSFLYWLRLSGNPELCGLSLSTKCSAAIDVDAKDKDGKKMVDNMEDDELETRFRHRRGGSSPDPFQSLFWTGRDYFGSLGPTTYPPLYKFSYDVPLKS
ncbi:hypothetical protein HYC85_010771 [Camellia sinensis]|uniref:Leucine-rich repeat-containing N-terminal plant-type domain-containing protein n=1 Tax=Camellia sinensis TaxID=4442 RepID=A0A7J7HK63_CAMSI|nr:hypothetical protein HYC85_010771 [Camellia sinensis]